MLQRLRGRRRNGERGASLVEFALIAPLLIMLVMGIVDFGWMLGQFQDVKHGTREAARLAAVDAGTLDAMQTSICAAMDISSGAKIDFTDSTVTYKDASGNDQPGAAGATAKVAIEAPVQSLTGFSSLPFANTLYPTTLASDVEFRLERNSEKWNTGTRNCP